MAQSATVRKEDFKDQNFSTGESFADLFENSAAGKLSEGSVVKGTIVGIEKDLAIIDVGLKSEGRVPLREFSAPGQNPELKAGDKVVIEFALAFEGRCQRKSRFIADIK